MLSNCLETRVSIPVIQLSTPIRRVSSFATFTVSSISSFRLSLYGAILPVSHVTS